MELEEEKGGGRGVREFVAVKNVGALGGARTSVLLGNLGPVGPETQSLRHLGAENLGFGGILRVSRHA